MGKSEINKVAAVENLKNYKCILPMDMQPDIKMAIGALKKQIEMKPLTKIREIKTRSLVGVGKITITEYYCRCFNKLSERMITTVPKKPNYCCRCGQKIDWSEIE